MKRIVSVASHPLSTGVVGFVVGLIAAYSVPGLAQFVPPGGGGERGPGPTSGMDRPMMDRPMTAPPMMGERGGESPSMGRPMEDRGGSGRPGMMPDSRSMMPDQGSPMRLPGGMGDRPQDRPMMDRPMMSPMGDQGQGMREGMDRPSFFRAPGSSDSMMHEGQGSGQRSPRMDGGMLGTGERREGSDSSNEAERTRREQEDQQREAQREAQREEQEKQQQARMLEQMKRGMQQFVKMLEQYKKQVDKWASKGINLSSECSQAYTDAKSLVDTVLKAESADALDGLDPSDGQEYMQTLQECRQTGERLSRIPQFLKRIDSEIKSLDKMWTRAKKGAPEAAQEVIAEGDSALQAIKQARAKLNDTIKSGELDDIELVVEDEIYGKFDDVRSLVQRLEALRNAKRYMSEYAKQMKMARSYLEKLKKRGKDVAELQGILSRAEQKYNEIKGLKPGSVEYQEAVQELAEIGQEFAEETSSEEDFGAQLDTSTKEVK